MVLAVVVVVVVVVGVPSPCASVRDEGRCLPRRVNIARWGRSWGLESDSRSVHSTVSEGTERFVRPCAFVHTHAVTRAETTGRADDG